MSTVIIILIISLVNSTYILWLIIFIRVIKQNILVSVIASKQFIVLWLSIRSFKFPIYNIAAACRLILCLFSSYISHQSLLFEKFGISTSPSDRLDAQGTCSFLLLFLLYTYLFFYSCSAAIYREINVVCLGRGDSRVKFVKFDCNEKTIYVCNIYAIYPRQNRKVSLFLDYNVQ